MEGKKEKTPEKTEKKRERKLTKGKLQITTGEKINNL